MRCESDLACAHASVFCVCSWSAGINSKLNITGHHSTTPPPSTHTRHACLRQKWDRLGYRSKTKQVADRKASCASPAKQVCGVIDQRSWWIVFLVWRGQLTFFFLEFARESAGGEREGLLLEGRTQKWRFLVGVGFHTKINLTVL